MIHKHLIALFYVLYAFMMYWKLQLHGDLRQWRGIMKREKRENQRNIFLRWGWNLTALDCFTEFETWRLY